jgi:hypothetical protein
MKSKARDCDGEQTQTKLVCEPAAKVRIGFPPLGKENKGTARDKGVADLTVKPVEGRKAH